MDIDAVEIDPVTVLYEQGLAFAEAGMLMEARQALREAYRLRPEQTTAICALARIEREHGELETCRTLLSEALQEHPQDPGICLELGCLFHETGQLEFALRYYRDAIKARPDFANAWNQLGRLFQQFDKPAQAEEAFTQALELDPNSPSAWNHLGLLHFFNRKTDETREALQNAIRLRPECGEYYFNLGMAWLMPPADQAQALKIFEMAVRLKPEFGLQLQQIGDHFFQQGLAYLAMPFYLCALKGQVDAFETYVKLAQCAERECEMQQALDFYQKALELKPDQWILKIRAALLLPMVYQSPEDVHVWRKHFAVNLEYLHQLLQKEKLPRAVQTLSMYSPPFLLAYQGLDNLGLLVRLSELWRKLFVLPASRRDRLRPQKRRIGLLCAFFYDHSITGAYLGMVRELRQRGHEVYAFSLGLRKADEVTAELQALTQWQTLPVDLPVPKLAEKILAADLDVLVFPEIGLDPLTYFLAHGRLAPVQVQLFGHPITSGISSVDYFVSAEPFELPGSQDLYSEKLIKLSRCPFLMARPPLPETRLTRSDLDLPESARIYLISAMLFKLHPNHDALFAQILERDPEALIVLIQPKIFNWQEKMQLRFEHSLAPWRDRIRFIPWMSMSEFFNLLLLADAALDTLHFSAGNVAYQAFALGVPLITLPGSSLRSRFTYGLYQQIGMLDCVANSPEEYVDLALRLAQDKTWQQAMRQQVFEKSSVLFEDTGIMAELTDFIEKVQSR